MSFSILFFLLDSTIFLLIILFFLKFLYFSFIFLDARRLEIFDRGAIIFIFSPSVVSITSPTAISPGSFDFFLYFSFISLAAICAFLPGSKTAISSNTLILSFVLPLSFFVFKYGFLTFLFLISLLIRFSFLKSVLSISFLIKCPASPGILFFYSFLGGTKI